MPKTKIVDPATEPDSRVAFERNTPAVPESIFAKLDARKVVYAEPPPEPIPVLMLMDQVICTAGNLTGVAAQAKAGKTAALAAMIAALLATDQTRDYLGFSTTPEKRGTVVVFDTEQSPYDAWSIQSRVLHRAGLGIQPEQLQHYYLLDLSTSERFEAVMEGTRRAAADGEILAVFVDGVADLLDDVNDQAEANGLISGLVKLAVEINAPIITVLHENPAAPNTAGKTRGHLGSQLERKAESNLRIVKDADGVSTIFSDRCRRATIPQHSGPRFQWSDDVKMHVTVESAEAGKSEAAKEQQEADLQEIFDCPQGAGGLPYGLLLERISDVFGVKKEGARKRLTKFRETNAVRKNSKDLWVRK